MKAATQGNPARWINAPKGITTLAVCRLSGKLAVGGRDHVEVANPDGSVVERSMVYKGVLCLGDRAGRFVRDALRSSRIPGRARIGGWRVQEGRSAQPGRGGHFAARPEISRLHTPAQPNQRPPASPRRRNAVSGPELFGVGKDSKAEQARQARQTITSTNAT